MPKTDIDYSNTIKNSDVCENCIIDCDTVQLLETHNNTKKHKKQMECIICLESDSVSTKNLFYFVKNNIYMCNCKCVVYTHTRCMQIWLENSPKCPICRYTLYQLNTILFFCKTLFKSCVVVFLTLIYIINISNAVKEEIQKEDFDTTFCRYINNTVNNTTVEII
jgi:hypothetical protein